MKIRPLPERILVTRVGEQEVGRHGIIIPDMAKEKPEGTVVAVGTGKLTDEGTRITLDVEALLRGVNIMAAAVKITLGRVDGETGHG